MAECLPGVCFFSHNLPSVSLTLFHRRYRVPVNECHPRQDMPQTSGGSIYYRSSQSDVVENGTKSIERIIFLKLNLRE